MRTENIKEIYDRAEIEKIYDKAKEFYGADTQVVVTIEELSELQKELTKVLRYKGDRDHLAEEIADVEIVVEQMKRMFNISGTVADWKQTKLKRLNDNVSMSLDHVKKAVEQMLRLKDDVRLP